MDLSTTDPQSEVELQQERAVVHRTIEALPNIQRETILLYYMGDFRANLAGSPPPHISQTSIRSTGPRLAIYFLPAQMCERSPAARSLVVAKRMESPWTTETRTCLSPSIEY